jgi:hypothetical protein
MRKIPIKVIFGNGLVPRPGRCDACRLVCAFVRGARSDQNHLHVSDGTWELGKEEIWNAAWKSLMGA